MRAWLIVGVGLVGCASGVVVDGETIDGESAPLVGNYDTIVRIDSYDADSDPSADGLSIEDMEAKITIVVDENGDLIAAQLGRESAGALDIDGGSFAVREGFAMGNLCGLGISVERGDGRAVDTDDDGRADYFSGEFSGTYSWLTGDVGHSVDIRGHIEGRPDETAPEISVSLGSITQLKVEVSEPIAGDTVTARVGDRDIVLPSVGSSHTVFESPERVFLPFSTNVIIDIDDRADHRVHFADKTDEEPALVTTLDGSLADVVVNATASGDSLEFDRNGGRGAFRVRVPEEATTFRLDADTAGRVSMEVADPDTGDVIEVTQEGSTQIADVAGRSEIYVTLDIPSLGYGSACYGGAGRFVSPTGPYVVIEHIAFE